MLQEEKWNQPPGLINVVDVVLILDFWLWGNLSLSTYLAPTKPNEPVLFYISFRRQYNKQKINYTCTYIQILYIYIYVLYIYNIYLYIFYIYTVCGPCFWCCLHWITPVLISFFQGSPGPHGPRGPPVSFNILNTSTFDIKVEYDTNWRNIF